MTDYSDYCPVDFPQSCPKKFTKNRHEKFPDDCPANCPEDCGVTRFNNFSHRIVSQYCLAGLKDPNGHRPQRAIERDLNKLRKALADLKNDVRNELVSRECQDLTVDELDEFKKIVLDGSSTLKKLEQLASAPFIRNNRHDTMERRNLIDFAIENFKSYGGEPSTGLQSLIADYLDAIAIAAGIEPFDAPRAVRDSKNR